MIEKTVSISNELGLHARAAARLVRLTSNFSSEIKVGREGQDEQIDAKSILGILLLAAKQGTRLQLRFEGCDEEEAARAVVGLIEERFGETR